MLNTDPRIPEPWRPFWERVETHPSRLIHFTTPQSAEKIWLDGHIKPTDPAPRDWAGLCAVFMCDPSDPSFDERFNGSLLDHFFRHSTVIDALEISPQTPLWRCMIPERASYYISLEPVSTTQFASHKPFLSSALLSQRRTPGDELLGRRLPPCVGAFSPLASPPLIS